MAQKGEQKEELMHVEMRVTAVGNSTTGKYEKGDKGKICRFSSDGKPVVHWDKDDKGCRPENLGLGPFDVGMRVTAVGDSTTGKYQKGDKGNICRFSSDGKPVVHWDKDNKGCRPDNLATVTMLHLSDTHNLHGLLTENLPSADVLIHTGDWTENGTDEEHNDFNKWLGTIKEKYKHIIVISGNHEWPTEGMTTNPNMLRSALNPKTHLQNLLTYATVLDHEETTVCGIKIFGSSWVPWTGGKDPDQFSPSPEKQGLAQKAGRDLTGPAHRFDEIPEECDVLMTHGPPAELLSNDWGSSAELRKVIQAKPPLVHCFGHLHHQRGFWQRNSTGWDGLIEYEHTGAGTWSEPVDFPDRMQLFSCNAMKHETEKVLVSGGRLIYAVPKADGRWRFTC